MVDDSAVDSTHDFMALKGSGYYNKLSAWGQHSDIIVKRGR